MATERAPWRGGERPAVGGARRRRSAARAGAVGLERQRRARRARSGCRAAPGRVAPEAISRRRRRRRAASRSAPAATLAGGVAELVAQRSASSRPRARRLGDVGQRGQRLGLLRWRSRSALDALGDVAQEDVEAHAVRRLRSRRSTARPGTWWPSRWRTVNSARLVRDARRRRRALGDREVGEVPGAARRAAGSRRPRAARSSTSRSQPSSALAAGVDLQDRGLGVAAQERVGRVLDDRAQLGVALGGGDRAGGGPRRGADTAAASVRSVSRPASSSSRGVGSITHSVPILWPSAVRTGAPA